MKEEILILLYLGHITKTGRKRSIQRAIKHQSKIREQLQLQAIRKEKQEAEKKAREKEIKLKRKQEEYEQTIESYMQHLEKSCDLEISDQQNQKIHPHEIAPPRPESPTAPENIVKEFLKFQAYCKKFRNRQSFTPPGTPPKKIFIEDDYMKRIKQINSFPGLKKKSV